MNVRSTMELPERKKNREELPKDSPERSLGAPGEEIEDPLGNLVGDEQEEGVDEEPIEDDEDEDEDDLPED